MKRRLVPLGTRPIWPGHPAQNLLFLCHPDIQSDVWATPATFLLR